MPNKSSALTPRASPPASDRPGPRSSPKPQSKWGVDSQKRGSPTLRSGRSGAPTPPRASPLPHGSATERRRHYASSPAAAAQRAVTPTSAYGPVNGAEPPSASDEPGAAQNKKHHRSTPPSLAKRTLRRSATAAPQADPRAPPSKQERRDHIRPLRASPPTEEVLVDADGTVAYSTIPGAQQPQPETIWVPPEHCHCCMQRAIARQRGRSEVSQTRATTSSTKPTRSGTPVPEAPAAWHLPTSRSFSSHTPINRQREQAGHVFLRNLFESYRKSSSAAEEAPLHSNSVRSTGAPTGTRASDSPTDPGRRKPSPIREQQHAHLPHTHLRTTNAPPARSRYGEAFHQRSLREHTHTA